ncbi:MAG: Ribokinase [Alphaproteobacteria bacterium MarineAlpha5_Bin9]|nr:MAG: Ribokinase [Alphaproteobacteria bacterium MarineAlpha5_Bin9]|tara:strand:+ start:28305 stop:29231 length:927 start_codon:yes stop_codon:yes gene_type:complete
MKTISILGIYVADLAFFADSIPVKGETILGQDYVVGPGGKGSNQAVAAAKAGGNVKFISKIGDDQFGNMAIEIYKEVGVDYTNVIQTKKFTTGTAGIFINKLSGENAITVVPGAAGKIITKDIDISTIKNSSIFLTQLELPIELVEYSLEIAKKNNVTTILNPAPAVKLNDKILNLIDYFTPNETEASFYVNHAINSIEDIKKASLSLLDKGIKNVIITLGAKGSYYKSKKEEFLINAYEPKDKVIDTTGAGDAFNAGLAVGLSEGLSIRDSIKFANVTAGLSTTKIGTAKSMPTRSEIDKCLQLIYD